MNFIWFVSMILLFISFLMYRKSEKTLDIIEWVVISFILFGCYNGIVAVLYTAVNLKINMLTLTFPNIIIAALMAWPTMKYKKFQSYLVSRKDFFAVAAALAVSLFVFITQFGGLNFNIRYETTDPALHYVSALQFFQNSLLIIRKNTLVAYVGKTGFSSAGPFLAYLNTGIIFKLFGGIIDSFYFYRIYILFDIALLFFSGMVMYYSVKRFINKAGLLILALFAMIYYICGYPLNTVVFGFPELFLAIIIIGCIIITSQKMYSGEISRKVAYPLLCFFIIGVFYSYHYFVPPLLLGIGISFLIYGFNFKKFRFSASVKEIIAMALTLFIPILLGLFYLFVLPYKSGVVDTSSAIKAEGYIYHDLYSNFIIMSIFAIYGFIRCIKAKRYSFENTILLAWLAYTAVMFTLAYKGLISTYYLNKNYYVLWYLIVYMCVAGCSYVYKEHRDLIIAYGICVIVIFTLYFGKIDSRINNKNPNLNPVPVSENLVDIFSFNAYKSTLGHDILNKDEINLIYYVEKNKSKLEDSNGEVPTIGNYMQMMWIYNMTGIWPKYNTPLSMGIVVTSTEPMDFKAWQNDPGSKYLLYFPRTVGDYIKKNDIDLSKYKIVYQNSGGAVLSK